MIYRLGRDKEETEVEVGNDMVFCQAKGQGVMVRFDQAEDGFIELFADDVLRFDKTFYVHSEQPVDFVVIQ